MGQSKPLGIEPSGPLECALPRLLLAAYSRRLRSIVAVAAAGGTEEVVGVRDGVGGKRVGVSDIRGHRGILVDHLTE